MSRALALRYADAGSSNQLNPYITMFNSTDPRCQPRDNWIQTLDLRVTRQVLYPCAATAGRKFGQWKKLNLAASNLPHCRECISSYLETD
jgi:hypothetical protein